MNRLLALLALAAAAPAQVSSSALLGEVRDQTSALAPGVKITARHLATAFTRTAFTRADGSYRMDELLPGTYSVTAEGPGFQPVTVEGVVLEVSRKTRLDLKLQVGATREAVTVTGRVSPVGTEEASLGYRLDYRALTSLPLAARNVVSLVTLGPGAVPRHLGGFVHDVITDVQEGPRGAVALNPPINGGRSTMNAFLFDGANNTDRNAFVIAVNPPLDAVQEFRIQSALPAAEFAQAGGGVVDVASRSGGQTFHGSAFEFFRNEAIDARNFFDDPPLPRPIFRQNQFGGSLGGPLPVPSTYFFAAYEGVRGKSAKSALAIVPDQVFREGDFRGRDAIFDPLSTDPVTGARQPFANNILPPARIDPIATRFLDLFEPLPNRPQGAGNYLDATPGRNTGDSVLARIDRQFGDHSRLFGRYTLNGDRNRVAPVFPQRPAAEDLRAQQAALGHTLSGHSWLNESRLSFTRLRILKVPADAFRTNVARELGLGFAPEDPFTFGLPVFLVTNFSMVTDSPSLPQVQRDNSWHVSDGLSLARGRRTWKFGFEWVHFQLNYLQTRDARGRYTFTGAFTGNPAELARTGDPFADFLLSFPQVTSRRTGPTQAYLRQNSYAGYLHHDWRASSRLTLNAGLRYEYVSPFMEARGNLLNLDYSGLPAAPRLVSVRRATDADRNNFAPRAGLALRLPDRLLGRDAVFRAGYGIYFSPEIAAESYDLILNNIRNERNETDGSRPPVLTLRDGFPRTAATGFPSYFGLDRAAPVPYVQQWSASLQRELPARVLAEVAYAGTKGTKLGRFRRFNTPLHVVTGGNLPPRQGSLQSLRPFSELGTIFQRQHISNSIYHSLQIKTEKQFMRRLGFLASFVWSKSIDDADSVIPGLFESFGAQDERNLRLERGLSFAHVGRRLSAAFVYDLPGVRPLRLVFANWRVSGIVTLQDGTPLNPVYFAFDPANTGTPNRPDLVAGQPLRLPRHERTIERFFNADAFRAPPPFHFGNAGRNILPGPGNNLFDFALHRRLPLREAGTIEFRIEAFNVFNHPNWGVPGPYPDFGPFFGRILATGQPRRIQLGLRLDF
ncbi:MAG: TonB-dependent receptor [Acidobacteriota bacterium]